MVVLTLINVIVLGLSIVVFGLSLKLYTEWWKAKDSDKKKGGSK